jgi:hypothetical protein
MTPYMTRSDVLAAGDVAGRYLSETIKKTDLATLTKDEWTTFLCIVVNEANKAAGDRIVSAWTIPVGAEG